VVTSLLAVLLAAKLFQGWKGHGSPERERFILFPEVSEVKKAHPGDDWPMVWRGSTHGEWIFPAAGLGRDRNPIWKNGKRKLLPISLAHGGSSR